MATATTQQDTMIIVNNDGMGHAEPELRFKLIKNYFGLLNDSEMLPGAVAFYASGVKMVSSGSPVIEPLQALEKKGVRIIICKTCLDFYGLSEYVQVGIVGGMTDIIAAQWGATKVITL